MQAVMHPKAVKTSTSRTPVKVVQVKVAPRPAAPRPGKRFLDLLMNALAAAAV